MLTHALRLRPGDDLRRALEAAVAAQRMQAAFVLSGIGSLRPALVRLAGAEQPLHIDLDVELLTLSGSVGVDHSHLHLSVSLPDGRVLGGHAGDGCTVRTTAEVLLGLLPELQFRRVPDADTGCDELEIGRRAS